jgi:hypothetical protein
LGNAEFLRNQNLRSKLPIASDENRHNQGSAPDGAVMALALGSAFAGVGSVMSLLRLTVAPQRKT